MGPDPEPEPEPLSGKARADHEWRLAALGAVALLVLGQGLLLAGWWWAAMLFVALPGTVGSLLLARRWQRMSAPPP